MEIEQAFEDALRSSRPFERLRDLAVSRRDAGETRDRILDAFEAARVELRLQDREADEDAVMEVMDELIGFCSPHRRIFPESVYDPNT